MGMDWYDMIAKRNGGYKVNAVSTIEGVNGEDIFEDRLISLLQNSNSVLDAGCGHGEFTIKMAKYTKNIIGFDNSKELLKIANNILEESKVTNVSFSEAWTHGQLPFEDGQFDLIYDRRGPTSIIDNSRVLRSGGIIFGIHSAALEKVKEKLENNGFTNIEIEEFGDTIEYFPNEIEFAKVLAAIPGNPDYTLSEYKKELQKKIDENRINGSIALRHWKYIWKAVKP